MAKELTLVLKVRNIETNQAGLFAHDLESAIGEVLVEECIVGLPAYFVKSTPGTTTFRVGLRFDGIAEEHISDTAKDVIHAAMGKLEAAGSRLARPQPRPSRPLDVKRLSSQLVSA